MKNNKRAKLQLTVAIIKMKRESGKKTDFGWQCYEQFVQKGD